MSILSATINAENNNKHNSSQYSLRTYKILDTALYAFLFNSKISQGKCYLFYRKKENKNRELKYLSGP